MLETHFTQPDNWRTGSFTHPKTGHTITFAAGYPDGATPDGVVVILPGLSEFIEKYYETARDLMQRNLSVWIIDWPYQGRSSRFKQNPHKRHSNGFSAEVQDLHQLLSDYIIPTAMRGDIGRLPLIMLGHSMGGHIGLRYLLKHPGIFKAAAFSAPMLGIRDISTYPHWLLLPVLELLRPFWKSYIPGGTDWRALSRKSDGSDIFSSDPVRDSLHNHWCKTDPALQVGSPTIRWVYEAIRSCAHIHKRLNDISLPVLLAEAGKDTLVCNKTIRRAAQYIPQVTLLTLPKARHEILMEKDEIRIAFLEAFDKLLKDHDILPVTGKNKG